MKIFFFISILLLGINKTHSQSICIDSSYTKGFYFTDDSFTDMLKIGTLDNGILTTILMPSRSIHSGKNIIFKINGDGDIDWVTYLTCKDSLQLFHTSILLQLKNGEFIIGGHTNYENYAKPDKVIIIKISAAGNIIWQKQLNNNYGSLISESVRLDNIQEGYNGDIIVKTNDRNVHWNLLNLTRLNGAGQVIWSNSYFGYAFIFKTNANIIANDGALHFWGIGEADCSIWNEGLKYIKFNNNTGFLEQTKTYCVEASSNPIRIRTEGSSLGHLFGPATKTLDNGNTVVFLQDYASRNFLLINIFDRNNNYIKSTKFMVPVAVSDSFKSNFWYDVNSTNGEIIFGFNLYKYGGNVNQPISFINYLNNNLMVQQQKVFNHPSQKITNAYGIFLPDGSINIMGASKTELNGQGLLYLNYSKTLLGATNDAYCNARDTVYGSFEPHTLQYGSTKMAYDSIVTNVYQSVDSSLFIFSTSNILDSMECLKISICDSLKINGPTSFCLNEGDTLRYSVYKNATCLKVVEWQIDTSFAVFTKTLNCTSIRKKFKQIILLIAIIIGLPV